MSENVRVEEAISKFEMRINGLSPSLGESILVQALRVDNKTYIADILRTARDFSKARKFRDNTEIALVQKRSESVIYCKKYIDLLCINTSYNDDYLHKR